MNMLEIFRFARASLRSRATQHDRGYLFSRRRRSPPINRSFIDSPLDYQVLMNLFGWCARVVAPANQSLKRPADNDT